MPFDYANANPNLKALKRILFALIAAAALCFAVTLTLIARAKPHGQSVHQTPARCACGGQCMRTARRQAP
jgi:hypothetical protein